MTDIFSGEENKKVVLSDKKTRDFIELLKKRTVYQIDGSDIKESCTAALLLLFSAIDSLSKLTCNEEQYATYLGSERRQGCNVRFIGFLNEFMRDKYSEYSDDIWQLRNDIVHTAISKKVSLSKNEKDTKHLEKENGILLFNTNQFLVDMDKVINELQNNPSFIENAKKRLGAFNLIDIRKEDNEYGPTPAADSDIFQ